MQKIIAGLFLTVICNSTFSETFSVRDSTRYFLLGSATHIVYTLPAQPFQPVYAWRTHTRLDGSPGIHSQDGDYIGETDANGVLTIIVHSLPLDPVHCGFITGERVAVGSRDEAQSDSLGFSILVAGLPSPLPPWIGECRITFSEDTRHIESTDL